MSELIYGILNPDVVIFIWGSVWSDSNKREHKVMDQVDELYGRLALRPVNSKNK